MRRLAAAESDVTVPSRDLCNEIGEAVRSVSSAATEMQSTVQSMFWIAEATSGQAVASVKGPATQRAKATEQIAAQIQAVQDRTGSAVAAIVRATEASGHAGPTDVLTAAGRPSRQSDHPATQAADFVSRVRLG